MMRKGCDRFSSPSDGGSSSAADEKLSHPQAMMASERAHDRRTTVSRTYRGYKHKTAKSCAVSGKASFRSTAAARAFIDTRDEWRGEVARVYRCEWCDWYHLTSRETRWAMLRTDTVAA
jgi:hypothetical protein